MKYDKRSVTDNGADLLAHSKAAGKRTVFESLAITDSQPGKDIDALTIDDLGNFLAFPISYIKEPAAKTWQPGAVVGNTNISVGDHGSAFLSNVNNGTGTLNNPLSVNTIGIIAHTDGENNDVLFAAAYANPGEAITVPNATDIPYKLTLDFAVKIDNDVSNNDITIQVNNAGMVNFADLQDVLQNYIRINGDGTVTQSPDFQDSVKRRGVELVDQNQLSNAINDISSYKVVDSNADILKLPGPMVYKSVWGNQNTLKNYPSEDGSSTIIVSTVNIDANDISNGKKVTVIDSWGNTYENNFSGDHWKGWKKDDSSIYLDTSTDLNTVTKTGFYVIPFGGKPKNTPAGINGAIILIVYSSNDDGSSDCSQMLFSAGIGYRTRMKQWGSFTDWAQYATNNDTNNAYQNAVNTAHSYTDNRHDDAISQANSYTDNKIGLMDDPYIDHSIIPLAVGNTSLQNPNNLLSVNVTAHYTVHDHQISLYGAFTYQNMNKAKPASGNILAIDTTCLNFSNITIDDFKGNSNNYTAKIMNGWIVISTSGKFALGDPNSDSSWGYQDINGWLIGIHQ